MGATFGNAAELIVAIVALRAGFVGLVKASLAGSILGNLLLILFASLIVTVIALDGESHWFEGAQLLALYALIALAVWFI